MEWQEIIRKGEGLEANDKVNQALQILQLESNEENWNEVLTIVKGKGRGKGRTKGGGKGDGACHHCGKLCHFKRDCWELDKLMQQTRGQGRAQGGGD